MVNVSALALVFVALVSGPHGLAGAAVIQVPEDHATIQSAIDAAAPGDEILVAPGSYAETIDFKGKAIALRSIGGPEVTTIDGSGLNQSVVRCVSGELSDTVLQGFTITGGSATFGTVCGTKTAVPRSSTASSRKTAPPTEAVECTTN